MDDKMTKSSDVPVSDERLEGPAQDVITLVIAAREFWEANEDMSKESNTLDKALEAFASRVPYENEPDAYATPQPTQSAKPLVITDEMVERASKVLWGSLDLNGHTQQGVRQAAKDALTAALKGGLDGR